ncbi:hypothetical protein D3P07_08630 [Paenibacillus sp. 1011MAR3C5]|uniref:hypothetical protein n=1 Tax=Paenibacillus sp. 1011MAR3C5 TaxID=1675787 RepID=UPI000E6CB80A|nr:hypothetical protein [Paenibacillus sp. 1011MAR3C5]RJE90262.1 hypothetical protein D3P07_08630 [Paenibacillus sp. 1011MAR3C5]
MVKRCIGCVVCFISLLISFGPNHIYATSWVSLQPEEVVQRSSVIVQGSYVFEDGVQRQDTMWRGYRFKVEKIYRGTVKASIEAGIESNDIGWVQDVQVEGSSFVLFLERSKNSSMLVPVAGPNGMIRIKNGVITHSDKAASAYYTDFLKQTKSKPPLPVGTVKTGPAIYWVLGLVFLILSFIIYLYVRRSRVKKNHI